MTLPGIGFRRTTGAIARHLFVWRARDMVAQSTLAAASGQAATFVRATSGTAFDSSGRLYTAVHSQPRWDAVLNSVTGLYEQTLALEPTRTNLVLQSENFGTTWAAIGTPTRTAAAKIIGDLVLDLLGDDSATVLEGYSQTVTFTGNAVKVIGIHLVAGTSTSTVLRLRDTTAAADRLLATITWAAGVPTVASVTGGVAIGSSRAIASGGYVFEFQTGSVTAANVNSLQVYPATTAALAVANTGTVYAGGVYAYNADVGGTYVKTTTATVTQNRDDLSYDAKWPMQDNETWYVRMPRPRWADLAGTLTTAVILSRGSTTPRIAVYFSGASRNVAVDIYDGITSQTASAAIPAGTGGFIEAAIQFADVKTAGKVRLDVGAGYGAYSGTTGPITGFTQTLVVGDASYAAGNQLQGGLTDAVIASGLQTLATMRGIAQR